MPDTAPTAKELTNLLGKSLFEIWNHLVVLIDKYYGGTAAAKHGNGNINIAAGGKRYVRFMQEKTV